MFQQDARRARIAANGIRQHNQRQVAAALHSDCGRRTHRRAPLRPYSKVCFKPATIS
jgi:hypothetical protein